MRKRFIEGHFVKDGGALVLRWRPLPPWNVPEPLNCWVWLEGGEGEVAHREAGERQAG